MTEKLTKAIHIANKAHEGQLDKAGKPYILHPLRVMLRMKNETDMIVAVLHDTIEDTDITESLLLSEGFSKEIVDAVVSLTRLESETYDEFVQRVSMNEIGRRVKLADLEDNLDKTRLPDVLSETDFVRIEKYERAKRFLS